MTCSLHRVGEDQLGRLRERPDLLPELLGFDAASAPDVVEVRPKGFLGLVKASRALRGAEVRRFAEFLNALSPADLERRYDPARMTQLDIYPSVIWQPPHADGESPLDWLLASFRDLRVFIDEAAGAGDGVIVHLG